MSADSGSAIDPCPNYRLVRMMWMQLNFSLVADGTNNTN